MNKSGMRYIIHDKFGNGEQYITAEIFHPMESGYRKHYRENTLIPANYIEDFVVSVDGKIRIELTLSGNISRKPLLSFAFTKPIIEGQTLNITWIDNHKQKTTFETVVNFNDRGRFVYRNIIESDEVM